MESLYKSVGMEVLPDEYLPDDYTGPSAGPLKQLLRTYEWFPHVLKTNSKYGCGGGATAGVKISQSFLLLLSPFFFPSLSFHSPPPSPPRLNSSASDSASEMTYIVSSGALNSTHSLTHSLSRRRLPKILPALPDPDQWRWKFEFESVGARENKFLSCLSTFLASKVQLVVLGSAFMMGSSYSLVSFLFAVLLLTVPPVPSHLKKWGDTCPRSPWSRPPLTRTPSGVAFDQAGKL